MALSRIRLWSFAPSIALAFVSGYSLNWLVQGQDNFLPPSSLISGIFLLSLLVLTFYLGTLQTQLLWRRTLELNRLEFQRRRATVLAVVMAAWGKVSRLDAQYVNSREERLRLRLAYHPESFISVIEALSTIPIHELGSSEAAIALAGMKKNMIDMQQAIERFASRPDTSETTERDILDLRSSKEFIERHYRHLLQHLRTTPVVASLDMATETAQNRIA